MSFNPNPAAGRSFPVQDHDPQRLYVVLDIYLIWRIRYRRIQVEAVAFKQ